LLSTQSLGTVFGVPVSLALCAAAVVVATLLLIAAVSWVALRRVERADLPVALLGLAHMIAALGGLLPWGRPTPLPPLPQQPSGGTEPTTPTVVLVRGDVVEGTVTRRAER